MDLELSILMSPNTLVSVMLPTRQRVPLLERTVRSLLETASQPSAVELNVAYDEDDDETHAYLTSEAWQQLLDKFGATSQTHRCPAWGYGELHNYYNLLASTANGKWLLLWNDDCIMVGKDWDQQVRENQDFVGLLHMVTDKFRSELALFPLVPRVWTDIFGKLSLCNLCDSWVQDICYEIGAVRMIPATVIHDRFDVTGNNQDATYMNRDYRKKIYKSDAMRQVRHEWALKLQEYITRNSACAASTVRDQDHQNSNETLPVD